MSRPYYILDGHELVTVDDVLVWGKWFESADRRVAYDSIGEVEVSTVFLGVDHNWSDVGAPLLFETMTFGPDSELIDRYSTWEEAEGGHQKVVAALKAGEL